MPCFDDIPEDQRPSYPCEHCGKGSITESPAAPGVWECDTCPWTSDPNQEPTRA